MHECLLGAKKKKWSGLGIDIEGATDPSTWTYSSGTHPNVSGMYDFDGTSQVDYIRLPSLNTPQPTGEDMEIRLIARIDQIFETTKPVYFLTKWSGNADATTYDWVVQRRSDGLLYFTIASISTSPIATSASVPIGQDFEIYWRRRGNQFYAEFNGVQCFNQTVAAQRSCNTDWMIGAYLNSTYNGPTVNAAKAKWSLKGLKINRL